VRQTKALGWLSWGTFFASFLCASKEMKEKKVSRETSQYFKDQNKSPAVLAGLFYFLIITLPELFPKN
jgi:hypothetical protein